jgi:hypothetical protein
MRSFFKYNQAFLCILIFILNAQMTFAYVPIRISIKFILDANNNRPVPGNLSTNAEINAEVNWANTILADNRSELRVELVELLDLAGVSQYYNALADETNRNDLRSDARNDTARYRWRNNAVNIYINGGTGSAISSFPGDNDIILMNQWCANTPSCILHELGHSLNLLHTFQWPGDQCNDTIEDGENWTRDDIAQNNFSNTYNNLTPSQQDQVDLVFNNVMSYHTAQPQVRLSACQMDRTSNQADSDRAWLLSREPVYVNSAHFGIELGRFSFPYSTLDAAVNAGLSGKAVVLQRGNYSLSDPLAANTFIVTRFGPSIINHGALHYSLPVNLENSTTLEVSNSIKVVRSEDTAARRVIKEAELAVKLIATELEKASIMTDAETKVKLHENNAIGQLLNAETYAAGMEKIAIQLELAQRYRDSRRCSEAIIFFNRVADNTGQINLRARAIYEVEKCKQMLDGNR